MFKFLCRLGLHHKKLVKHFTSIHTDENNVNTFSLDFKGYECLRCRTRFVEEAKNSWPMLYTVQEVDYWVNQRASRLKKRDKSHLKIIK